MTEQVYITTKMERRLEQMARQTNAPAVAAQRARQIIGSLIRGHVPVSGCAQRVGPCDAKGPDPAGTGLMRYRRDKRVKNSLKFDLGQGFRLICIKEKKAVYVMFAGDHDSCDAWLDHFTKKRPHRMENTTMSVFPVENKEPPLLLSAALADNPDGDYDPLRRDIPQEILRRVFRGLCTPD